MSEALKPVLATLAGGATLTRAEAEAAFDLLLAGAATPAQTAAFLMALRVRGETVDELTGAVAAMRARMLRVAAPAGAIDIVGTGGDGHGTYNVSTLAAIIVAACGVPVAKHGNRAASSRSGSSDVLAALGVAVGLGVADVERCLAETGLCFMAAPTHHAAMRHVAPVRGELGIRTIFNLLGPLSNPAGVTRLLVGAYAAEWLEPMARVLGSLGAERAWVVRGADGLDEVSTTGPTEVVAWEAGAIRRFTITPEDLGVPRATLADLKGGDARHNAAALTAVLDGAFGPYRDIGCLNAAAALVVAGRVADLGDGLDRARRALGSGAAKSVLDRLVRATQATLVPTA
ncbi:Anthranilate phosphoribosyltransferase [Beijerinckiaceae bacterium RH AL1]|nr:Anthranilate phosphoribosyltransferase [Beijerinckiaceae bacterium RH CH11]VVB45921.1 Anthranilate phosphoribosyltransferase [Beijerinckiaceae bacterium RH AL8]VVC55069.1 Anthranilate phosphoribosyltransferase [Beijerinckiaceae bacterium RH AL1]